MCDINENEIEQEEIDSGYLGYEEQMGLISVDEELKRIQIQDNPTSKISKETKNSDFYKESIIIAETVAEIFQKMIGFGIDYQNALVIATNFATNDANLKQLELQSNIQANNQP